MFSELQPNYGSLKHASFFTWQGRKQTVQGECFLNERQPNSPEHEDRSGWQRCKTRLQWLVWLSTQHIRKDISKLFFFHSKGGRCSFCGLLHCDDRRSPWWASRDGPQHDHIRSDTVMISMNFNRYASLVILVIIPVLFCFWTQNFKWYTSVSFVWFLLPYVSLQSNWAWKPFKLGLSILFSLWGFSPCSRFNNVN